jgi:hypothetical protein
MNHIARCTRILAACAAVATLTVAPAAAQDDLEDWQRAELRAMLEVIEAALDGRLVPSGDPFEFRADFLKGTDGNAYVPFTLSIDPDRVDTPTLSMYLYVVEPGDDNPIFEDAYFADVASGGDEPIRLSRAFAAPGGAYDVYIVLRESSRDLAPESDPPGDRDRAQIDEYCGGLFPNDLGSRVACQEQEYLAYRLQRRPRLSFDASEESAAMMMLRSRVDVPDLWNGRLQLSSVIVPEVVEPMAAPLTPEQQILSPYSLGTTRIVPKLDQDFGKQAELSLIFLVYNPGLADQSKPDITIEYTFHQRADGREEYFNRTNPQGFNGQTLPPGFDVTLGHQIVAGQTVPLSLFPAGDYRLEIKVTDNTDSTEIIENVMFTVLET